MLCEYEKAPNFTLQAIGRRTVSLSDFRGKRNVVLFFYRRNDNPICLAEAEAFRDLYDEFILADTAIVGISADHLMDHESYARKNKLPFVLLSDEDRVVWNAYSSYRDESGKPISSKDRLTCVIDKEGRVRKIWPEVTAEGHAAEVLAFVNTLQQTAAS
ncbi:MAG: peroxiredoxin [Armatimonadetes bacterium]|jgi:peroxiredoxin Q/BCP|nr:peroxiredoxin [Armatimonadota bacterium]